ncbi:MAG: tryptophan synthase subunit alpha [Chitinophagales bacterium]|nr:tryptophan synthase subunit alpha [Chitinophagales bacterium]
MNRLQNIFQDKDKKRLSIFCTAGFPNQDSLPLILSSLQQNGVDFVEIGMPFSDPTADGPIIQESNKVAIDNGMTIKLLFEQLENIRNTINMPLVLMGYLNPVLQFGIENFLKAAANCGIDGIIIPDLPMYEYETEYQDLFKQYKIQNIFLITPQTSEDRIRKIDTLSDAFIYAVSTHTITGGSVDFQQEQEQYFNRLQQMQLKNPIVIGFGIKDKASFNFATKYAQGAIIGSAFVKAIENSENIEKDIQQFIQSVLEE